MADWVKIALKTGLIVLFTTAIFALFVAVQFPAIELSSEMIQGIGFAKSVAEYWMPNFDMIFQFTIGFVIFYLGIHLVKFSLGAAKWLFKVNE